MSDNKGDPLSRERSLQKPTESIQEQQKSSTNDTQSNQNSATIRAKKLELASLNCKPAPFTIHWIYGYNPAVPMINLNKNGSTILFYAAVNCSVLYNWTTNKMKVLQGHKNLVTFTTIDAEGKWLVTADSGPENIIIIWDSSSNYPCKTLFSPHGEAPLAKLALSADAKYLLTLAYTEEQAELRWWMWSYGLDVPHAELLVDIPLNSVVAMGFNPVETTQFLIMTKQDVWIGVAAKIIINERGVLKETDDYELKIQLLDKKLNPEFGYQTCYTFVKNTRQVLVATSRGAILLFGYTMEYNLNVFTDNYEDLRFIKGLKLETHRINVIKYIDGLIVTGNESGGIKFYNDHLMLLYWVQDYRPGCVRGLSFNLAPRSYQIIDAKCNIRCPCWEKVQLKTDPETGVTSQLLLKKALPCDATTSNKPFVVRDFIISTREGVHFMDFVTEKVDVILNFKPCHISAISVHPEKPLISVGYVDGCVELREFVARRLSARMRLRDYYTVITRPDPDAIRCDVDIAVPELAVTALKYSPSGLHLACGLNTGRLLFLDPSTADPLTPEPAHETTFPLLHLTFSFDSLTLAVADSEDTVLVYKYNCDNFQWVYIGKHRAHSNGIASLLFTPRKKGEEYGLISLGHDRTMVEYDIATSKDGCLELYSVDRFEQTAVPLGGILWPNVIDLNPEEHNTNLPLLLIVNDEYKYKIVNYETTMTLSTMLGPRYSTPARRVLLAAQRKHDPPLQYLIFATKNIIGLQKLPLDGNPWMHCGVIAHPVEIIEMCFREDFGFLFTIGAKDSCMIQWNIKFNSADSIAKRGGVELEPYYCLIEGGHPGWLFGEIRDLFYFIQIQCQGIFSPSMRSVKDYIPLEALADLMRAIGFYPSEYEVENLLCEAKYRVYQKNPSTQVNFEEFVKLYINHRPAFGDSFDKLRDAFHYFGELHNKQITRDEFMKIFKNYGECFPKTLTCYLLSILHGYTFEDRTEMSPYDYSFLPEIITFDDLTNILGIENIDSLESID